MDIREQSSEVDDDQVGPLDAAENCTIDESSPSCPCSISWMSPEDFFTLAHRAGLRSHDAAWMEDFNRLCEESWPLTGGESLDDRVSGHVLVSIVMDDLIRHCQQTQDSLLEMMRILQMSTHDVEPSQNTLSYRQSAGFERLSKLATKSFSSNSRQFQRSDEAYSCQLDAISEVLNSEVHLDRLCSWRKDNIDETAAREVNSLLSGSSASSSFVSWPAKDVAATSKESRHRFAALYVLMKELWMLLPMHGGYVADKL